MSSQVPDIGFRDLEGFLVLVEEQHFGRAARRLAITVPALDATLRRLEVQLDVPLVSRHSPQVTPTAAGLRFTERVRSLLGELELAAAEAGRAAGEVQPVRIGAVPDLPLPRLQAFLGAMYTREARLPLDAVYMRTAGQIRSLKTGRLDLGLFHHAGEVEGIEFEPVFTGELLAAFLPVGHPLADRDSILAGDLLEDEHVLVVPPHDADPALAASVVGLLSDAGHDVRDVREASGDDPRSLLLAVAQHRWIAIEPASTIDVVGDVAALVTTRPLEPPVRMPDTVLAWRTGPPPELEAIASLARDAARRLFRE